MTALPAIDRKAERLAASFGLFIERESIRWRRPAAAVLSREMRNAASSYEKYASEPLALEQVGYKALDEEAIRGKGNRARSFAELPPDALLDFAGERTDLAMQLAEVLMPALERDGLVSRTVTPSIPPRVDYELTELGHSLQKPICGLATWALDNVEAIHAAQARFDLAHDEAEAA